MRRIERSEENEIWADYDPEAARRAWRRSVGVLRGLDIEEMLAEIKTEREQDSLGRPA